MIEPNEEVPKIAKPTDALAIPVIFTQNAEEFVDWVLSLPPDFKETPEGLAEIHKALEEKYPLRQHMIDPKNVDPKNVDPHTLSPEEQAELFLKTAGQPVAGTSKQASTLPTTTVAEELQRAKESGIGNAFDGF